MNALLISWIVLSSIFLQDVTAPQTSTTESFHISPRSFTAEPTSTVFENDEHACVPLIGIKEEMTAATVI